jgi:enoyl-CoA hydratase/carnithine racemase
MASNAVMIAEPEPGVAVVTLNRPEKRNALSAELKRALTGAGRELAGRTVIGAVVLERIAKK